MADAAAPYRITGPTGEGEVVTGLEVHAKTRGLYRATGEVVVKLAAARPR
jgi:hypothetical protein